jgi:lysophospholipase L1-like esterase
MYPVKIYAFGESTFQGYHATDGGEPHDESAYAVPIVVKDTISNAGVSCAVTNHAADMNSLAENASGHNAFMSTSDLIVLINSGLNDAYHDTVSSFMTTLKSLINEARQAGKIAVIQSPNTVTQTWSSRVNAIRSYINSSLAGSLGVRVETNGQANSAFDGTHPDADGYTAMATALTTSSSLMSPAAVKMIGLAEVVTRIYIAGLARGPEQSGLDYWVGELLASTKTETQVAEFVVAANTAFDSMTDAQFVSAIYQNLFNDGSADPTGQAYWVSKLSTVSRGQDALDITIASVDYPGSDEQALTRQRCFNNKIKMGLAYGLCARNNTVMNTSTMSAITDAYSTVTSYTSGLFPALPD